MNEKIEENLSVPGTQETQAAYFYLRQMEGVAVSTGDREDLFFTLDKIGALTTKIKLQLNTYLKKTLNKELIDFSDGYAFEIDEKLAEIFDNAFYDNKDELSDDKLRERIERARTVASGLPALIALLASETSVKASLG